MQQMQQPSIRKRQRRRFSPKTKIIITSIVTFIGLAILSGIFGNAAFALLTLVVEKVSSLKLEQYLLWLATIFCFLCFLGMTYIWWFERRRSQDRLRGLRAKSSLLESDDSFLRLIPNLINAKDLDYEMHRVMQKLLSDAIEKNTARARRGLLLRPDAKAEYLEIWENCGVWLDHKDQKKFYIGQSVPGWQRGIAGEAFLIPDTLVANITVEEDGSYKCDRGSYISFEKGGTSPSHRSLICVPIVTGLGVNDRLGVVCFDSTDPTAFNSPKDREMLQLISRRIATALQFYQELKSKYLAEKSK